MDTATIRSSGGRVRTPTCFFVLVCDVGGHRSAAAHRVLEAAFAPRTVRCEDVSEGILVAVPVSGPEERRGLARTAWLALRHFLTAADVTVAGGAAWHARGGRSVAALQARQALVAGRAMFGPDRTILIDDLGALSFLLGRPPTHLREFSAGALGPLAEVDCERSDTLLGTTSDYLRLGCNLAVTARERDVHRNTVRQRLNRVTALTGLDPDDPDDRFTLQTAIMARQLALLLAGAAADDPGATEALGQAVRRLAGVRAGDAVSRHRGAAPGAPPPKVGLGNLAPSAA